MYCLYVYTSRQVKIWRVYFTKRPRLQMELELDEVRNEVIDKVLSLFSNVLLAVFISLGL